MLSLMLCVAALGTCAAAPPAMPTPEQGDLLRQRDAMWDAAMKAWQEKKHADAIATMGKVLRIEQALLGPWHRGTESTAESLGNSHQARGEWAKEADHRRIVIEARRRLDGEGHYRTVDARLELAEALAQQKRTPAQREALARARTLHAEAVTLYRAGQAAKAIPLARQALEIHKDVLGEKHPSFASGLNNLGLMHKAIWDHAAALPLYRQALELNRQVRGERHPAYATSLINLAALHHDMGDHGSALPLCRRALEVYRQALGTRHPDYANSLNRLAGLHRSMGALGAALPLYRQALEIRRQTLGEKHPDYATSLGSLATLHREMGDHATALPLQQKALAITRQALGEKHPDYAQCLNSLAALHHDMGDHKAALPLYRKALEIIRRALGEKHPHHAASLAGLASLHESMGDHEAALPLSRRALEGARHAWGEKHPHFAQALGGLAGLHQSMGDHKAALPLYRQALEIFRQTLGERHPGYASCLASLATLYLAMGDHEAALPLHQKALEIRGRALGEKHPDYAQSLNSLATLHHDLGEYKAALALQQKALEITRQTRGENHPSHAAVLHNLAALHREMGDHEAALPLCRHALEIRRRTLGEKHPGYATSLGGLALLYHAMGDHEAALPLSRKALEITRQALGARHPDHAQCLHNLAALHHEMGRPGTALPLHEQAMSLTRRQLALDASVQSERQQRAAAADLRYRLNIRLSIPDESASFSHNHVLAWKGSAFAAQQARRRFLVAEADPDTRALALELRDKARSLALLASRTDAPSRKRAEVLIQEKEDLEVRLARLSAAFRLAVKPPASEAFRAGLPAGAVLIDLLVHTGNDPDKPAGGQKWRRRLVAWVVRADAPTLRLDLGPMTPIEDGIAAWREAIEAGRDSPAATRLRETVWAPLERHLAGAKAVLISPDEALGRLPFGALPGKEKGKYLLEEVPLAILPVPQVLEQLLQPAKGKPSLLTLGGVDFGGGPEAAWRPLPATGPEADAITARFRALLKGGTSSLAGTKATKLALAEALPRHRFAHLATHGYFAPASMKSALGHDDKGKPGLLGRVGVTGWDPALLSGIVLAGANRPTLTDDGLLKASEVAEMDLSAVELAVLSACQTGLGKEAGGEGILGLQRAFAVAGCKSVVSSLWSVHDAATAVLMERFYHHLWQKKLSKLESLRRAQLDILHHPEWVEGRAGKMRGTPGLRAAGKASEQIVAGKAERRSPPAWWAAWQLSGGWI